MLSEPFAVGNSIIHRTDPRFRLVSGFLYSIAVAVLYSFPALIASIGFSTALLIAAGLDGKAVFKRLALINGFVLFFWLILPFTTQGNIIYAFGPINIYEPGIILAAQISLKSNAIIMAFIALVSTMNFSTLGHSLSSLGFPRKFVFLFVLTYRYIFVIELEYKKIWRSIKIRGFSPKTSLHCYKTYAYMIGMIFVKASARADRVYRAMLCRGFNGNFYSLAHYPSSRANWIFLLLVLFFSGFIILMEIYYYA
jgi:cobalt/nickel transport system permease protein